MKEPASKWQGKTDGLPWMHRSLVWMLRYIPVDVIYAVMDVVIVFYMLFSRSYTKASYHYFRTIHRKKPIPAVGHVYLLFRQFGQVVIDRFAVYAGKQFEIELEGNELVVEAMKKEEGCVMLSSHVGNYEMAGYVLRPTKPMYAIMFGGEKQFVLENRKRELERNGIRTIVSDDEWSYLYSIHQILQEGNMLTLFADRNFGSPKTIRATILGKEANLPRGPFTVAGLYEHTTVLCAFVMKETKHKYHVYVRQLKGNNAQSYARAFADELTGVINKYPHQWYNFFEFWKKD